MTGHKKGIIVFAFLLAFVSVQAQEKEVFRASLPEDHSLNMLFNSLREALERKEHRTALDVLDSIERFFEKNGDRFVVRVGSVYYGARLLLQRLLAGVPEDAVETFAPVFLNAELLLERAKKEPCLAKEVLRQIASRSQLEEALKIFIPYSLERGEFTEALHLLESAEAVLDGFEDERIRFYAAAVHAALGRLEEARRIVFKMKNLTFCGRRMSPSEALKKFIRTRAKKEERPRLLPPGQSYSISLQSPFDDYLLTFTTTPVLPQTVDDSILLNTANQVCRLNSEGRLWSVQLVTEKPSQPYLYSRLFRPTTDGTLVFFTEREKLSARRLDDGSFVWSSEPIKDSLVLSPPIVDGSDVFVYAILKERELKAVLFCFDARTGRQRWFVTIATGFPQNPFNSAVAALPPVVVGERIFIVTSFEVFCAISKDGRLLWAYRYPTASENLNARRMREGERRRLSLPIVCGENIIAIPPDSVFALAFSTREPKIVWRLPSASEYSLIGACRIDDKRIALFGTALLLLDSSTGIIKRLVELPSPADSALVEKASLWLLSNEGRCLFRVTEKGVEEFLIPELRAGSVCGALKGRLFISSPREVIFFDELDGEEDDETKAIRSGNIDPEENPELYERWRKGLFGPLLRGRLTLEDVVRPFVKRWRKENPLKVARVLRKLSELLTPEDAGRLLLDSALLFLASRRYAEALEALSEAVDSSSEVVSFGALEFLPMPQTSAALALLIKDRLPNEVLQSFEKKAVERLKEAETSSDIKNVFFAYPYTVAGGDAALDAARKLITTKRTEEAEKWLLSIVALPVSDGLRTEAFRLLLRIYESVGDGVRARWAKRAVEEVKKGRAVPQPDSALWLPIKLVWRTLPFLVTDEEMRAMKVRIGGRGAILRYGKTVMDAIDAEDGAPLWRLKLRTRSSLPLQRSDGRILVVSGDTLAVVDEKSGEVLKRIDVSGLDGVTKNEGEVRIFDVDEEKVCLLDGAGSLLGIDTAKGAVVWRKRFAENALERTSSLGKTLLLVDESAEKLSLVDASNGTIIDVVKAGEDETILDLKTVDERFYLLFTSDKGQSIGAYTVEGKRLWRKTLDKPSSELRILTDGTVLSVPEWTALRPTFSAFAANGALKWKYALEAPSPWLKTTECDGRLLVLTPKGDGDSECRIVDIRNGVEKERVVLGIDDVSLFFSSGNFAIAVEDSFNLSSVEVLDVRRASAVGTLLSLNGWVRTGISSAGVVIVMNASGTIIALGSDVDAPSAAASAAAKLILGGGAEAASRYARALRLLGELDAATSTLNDFLTKNPLYSNPKALARIEALLAETVFSSALMSAPTVDVYYTPHPPDIDGSLEDEWQRIKAIELRLPSHLLPIQRADRLLFRWFAEEDLAARVYLMWDEKSFYALLDVSDQSQRPFDDSEKSFYKGDVLLVAVENVLIGFGLMVPQPRKGEEERRLRPKGKYMVKRKNDNSGFIYEFSMPWDYLKRRGVRLKGEEPSAGDSFRLNFAVVDDDTGLGSEKTLNLAPGLCCGRRDVIRRGFIKKAFATAVLRK